ncbi:MAG: hypothetical protein LBS34_00500 [Rickettsiales bacterium]|nr:hypothetical protein [Rickettsiales bacterium]
MVKILTDKIHSIEAEGLTPTKERKRDIMLYFVFLSMLETLESEDDAEGGGGKSGGSSGSSGSKGNRNSRITGYFIEFKKLAYLYEKARKNPENAQYQKEYEDTRNTFIRMLRSAEFGSGNTEMIITNIEKIIKGFSSVCEDKSVLRVNAKEELEKKERIFAMILGAESKKDPKALLEFLKKIIATRKPSSLVESKEEKRAIKLRIKEVGGNKAVLIGSTVLLALSLLVSFFPPMLAFLLVMYVGKHAKGFIGKAINKAVDGVGKVITGAGDIVTKNKEETLQENAKKAGEDIKQWEKNKLDKAFGEISEVPEMIYVAKNSTTPQLDAAAKFYKTVYLPDHSDDIERQSPDYGREYEPPIRIHW